MKLRTEFSIGSILLRGGLTVLALLIIYFEYGPVRNVEVDMVNMLAYGLFLPAYLVFQTIVIALLAGTPIRAIQGVYNWWFRKPCIPLLLLVAGIVLCLLSDQDGFAEYIPVAKDSEETFKEPFYPFLYAGWFTTAFALLHFYPESLARFWKKDTISWPHV
jgi:hypothetical protein